MKRLALLLALAALVALAWALRSSGVGYTERAGGSLYAGLDDSESAYRLRSVELVLVGGTAPRVDRFLEPLGDATAPWPPLVQAAIAFVAARALERDPSQLALAGFDEGQLERFARALGPALGALATLALAVLAWSVATQRRALAAGVAASLYALGPAVIVRESAGALHAHSWIVLLGCAQLGAFAVALRARERVDVTIGALAAGVLGGISALAGPEAWPLPLAALGALLVLAARADRAASHDAWGSVFLFAFGAATMLIVSAPGRALARLMPDFEAAGGGLLACSPETLACSVAPFALAWWANFRERADPLRATLLAAGFAALACAFFDRRFLAPLAVSGAGLAATAVSGAWLHARAWRVRTALAVLALGLAVPLAFAAARRASPPRAREAFVGGLRWLREHSPSPGAFNHPEARQDWRVASAPALAGSIAFHARRPVLAASFDGGSTASVADVLRVLASPDAPELVQRLGEVGARYLILTPRMLRDPRLAAAVRDSRGLLAELALPEPGDSLARFEGLERVYASSVRETSDGRAPRDGERAGPVISIFRRTPDTREAASLRPSGSGAK